MTHVTLSPKHISFVPGAIRPLAFIMLLGSLLFGLKTNDANAQCTGTAMGVTSLVSNLTWAAPTVPVAPAPHPWPNVYPPISATFGTPVTSTCTICPATFSVPINASQYAQIYMCQGNEYTFSLCTSAPANNFSLSITSTTFAAVAAGYYGPVFDNDGCGTPNGPAQLTWSPQTNGLYRVRVFQNPCVLNAGLTGTLVITCSVPTPPPNDVPCNAIAFVNPVPIDCTYEPGTAVWGSTETGLVPNPGCGAYFGRDIWYSAVVPASGNIRFQTTLVSATSLGMAVYNAPACNAPLASWSVVACNAGPTPTLDVSGIVTPGSTIYVRIWPNSSIGNMGTFNICAFEPTPPFNDLPCGAFDLPTPAVCSPTTYDTEFATNTTPPGLTVGAPSCGGAINNDVWFEVTVPATGAFTVNTFAGTLSNMAMAWYRLSVGGSECTPFSGTMTMIACNDDQFAPTNMMPRINSQTTAPAIAPPLVPGETIFIRVWPQGATLNGTFSICATENLPPPNDEACGAIPLATSLTCNLTPTTNEGASTNNAYAVPPCGAPVQNDVWYSVVVPPNGQLEFNTQAVGLTDAAFALYTSSGGCAPANLSLVPPINCSVTGSGFSAGMPLQLFAGLTPGSTVYLRVWRQTGNVGPFNICARQTAAAPLYGCDLNSSDSGGPTGNYGNNEVFEQTFCPVNAGDVVAIDFTAFSTQLNSDFLTVYNGPSIASPVLGVFSGGQTPPGLVSSAAGGCLTIRFTSNGSVVSTGWVISVSCGPPIQPAPGVCHTTTPSGTVLSVVGSNFFDSGGAAAQYTNNELSTYTFCPSTVGEVITLTFSSFNVEANFDFLTVFQGPTIASPNLGTFTGAATPGTFTGALATGGCLTIRWTSDFSIVSSGWSATIRCGLPQPPPPPPPPPTGICGTTVFDPGGPTGNYSNAINQNPNNFGGNNCWPYSCLGGGATIPPVSPNFGGTPGVNGWWQTYCPDIPGDAVTLNFTSFNLEFGWDNLYVYNGPVVSPNNANGTQWLSGNGLPTCGGPAGWCNQTLGAGGFTGNINPGTFTSTHPTGCITVAMTSDDIVNYGGWEATVSCQSSFNPSAACIFALRLYDIFGDGWSGSSITVVINGGTPSTYTLGSGQYEQVLISANNGSNIQITYNGWGYFPQDNYWTFDVVGQPYSLYQSNIPAVSGTVTLTGVNCTLTIPPPNEDCPGATILCDNSAVQTTPQNNGSVGDFTAANSACLGIYERAGEWFTFRAGASPNIGFSIAPAVASTDINFAIWGPFSSSQTVPQMCQLMTTTPKRCTFASAANTFTATGSYATGMGHATYSSPQFNPAGTVTSQTVAGNGWVPGIAATPGDIYVIFISNYTENNSLATLTWTGGTIDCFLPVEMSEFNAEAREAHVDVTWSTASEIGSAWFDVQRSADNEHFEDIGRVMASGNSSARSEYLFVDRDPLPGYSYYRLNQVDLDGTSELSHSVPVYFKSTQPMFQVYPNPVRDELYVSLDGATEGQVHWRMLDASGRLASSGNLNSVSGMQQLQIRTAALESGAYMLVLQQNGEELGRKRFVKH